jgi:anti-anti-sigma regulatory factor
MLTQITKRSRGNLTVVDVKGSVTAEWVNRVKSEILHYLQSSPKIALNLTDVTQMDSLGIKALVEILPLGSCVIRGRNDVMELFEHYSQNKQFHYFLSEAEIPAANAPLDGVVLEVRSYPRSTTALTLRFYRAEDPDKIMFRATVTNLSEGGLFAEYLDLENPEYSLELLNPYEFQWLMMEITWPEGAITEVRGKVVHLKVDGEQLGLGIQFDYVNVKTKKLINQFISQHTQQEMLLTNKKGQDE